MAPAFQTNQQFHDAPGTFPMDHARLPGGAQKLEDILEDVVEDVTKLVRKSWKTLKKE